MKWNEGLKPFSIEITSPDIITTRPLQDQSERPSPCDEVPNELPPAGSHAGSCIVSGYTDLTCCVGDADWIGTLISHDPPWDIGCKPSSPVSLSDTSVWVVTEPPGGDIGWWMRLGSSVRVCLFHLITSLNYSVLLNVLSAAFLPLSLSLSVSLIGLFLSDFFLFHPSTKKLFVGWALCFINYDIFMETAVQRDRQLLRSRMALPLSDPLPALICTPILHSH